MNKIEDRKLAFINKAKIVHKDENLDYSKVNYINNRTKVIIIDNDLKDDGTTFGEFEITPSNLLQGKGHPLKRSLKISKNKRFTTEHIIELFKEKHKDEDYLDYSKVEYKGMDVPVIIICHALDNNGNEYGEFKQTPRIHLKGCTHPRLSADKNSKKNTKNTDYFIEKSKLVHRDLYDYSKSNYVGNDKKIEIICQKHGSFFMTPENHYYGKGCPKCGKHLSHKEDEIIQFLIDNDVNIIHNDRTILNGKELDILIPSKNIAIEYNGLRWHTEEYGRDKNYHLNKTNECLSKGIKLIQIFEDEYINKKDIVLNKLSHILNIQHNLPKIMGRKCTVKEIEPDIAKEFLNKYHIQGYARSTTYLGAFYGTLLIAVMSFIKEDKKSLKWELNRFASDYHYVCQGIGGKLFKYFIKLYNPTDVKSFADRRWTIDKDNNLYTKLGFRLSKELNPNYRYVLLSNPKERFHKFNFRKDKLHNRYNLHLSMTESEMVKELGYGKIWDCGLFKYVWHCN